MTASASPRSLARLGALLLALGLVAGCKREPVKIIVKLPRESVESTQAVPTVPTFTQKNEVMSLRASAFDDKGRYMGPAKVKWSSSDPSVVVVNQEGQITTLSSGKVTIKAVTTDTQTPLEAGLEVPVSIPSELKIQPPEGDVKPHEIHLGEEKRLIGVVLDDKGQPIADAKVQWRSSTYAATVDPSGLVEGGAIGETRIIAEHKDLSAGWDMEVLDWKK